MKLTFEQLGNRATNALDSWVEDRVFSLQPRLQIDEANIRLEHRRETSPAYRVQVHLVTPGPDMYAEGRDHTLRAAFEKVMAELRGKINGRTFKRQRRRRSSLQGLVGKARTGRNGHARR